MLISAEISLVGLLLLYVVPLPHCVLSMHLDLAPFPRESPYMYTSPDMQRKEVGSYPDFGILIPTFCSRVCDHPVISLDFLSL